MASIRLGPTFIEPLDQPALTNAAMSGDTEHLNASQPRYGPKSIAVAHVGGEGCPSNIYAGPNSNRCA